MMPQNWFRFCGSRGAIPIAIALLVVLGCVTVTSFVPEEGSPGTQVTIDGKGFKSGAAGNTVKFGGEVVPTSDVISATPNKLKVKVPPGAKTGLISVSNSSGTGQSKKNFRVIGAAKWTFMVYLDADNNLEPDGLQDFLEMASVGSSTAANILVQMDRTPGYTSAYGNWTGTRRFLVQAGDNPGMTPLQDLGEQNMGDPAVLQAFVEWGVNNYPSEYYALVIWNHGGGWRELMKEREMRLRTARSLGGPVTEFARAIAWDDTDNDVLYMKEVQTALGAAKDRNNTKIKLDLLGFDACLMAMVEVAYAARDSAVVVVGSEDLEPLNGWPYDDILGQLTLSPSMGPKDLGGVIVSEYVDSYTGSGITQSAMEQAKLSALVAKINDFTGAATGEWAMFKSARLASRQYPDSRGVDLWDFANRVNAAASSSTIKAAAVALRGAVDDFVFAEEHSADMSGSHGVAIYFPATQADFNADPDHAAYTEANTFMTVDFVTNASWDNWLQTYYANIP